MWGNYLLDLMDYRYLRYIFGGSNQKMSSGGVPGGAPTKIINVGASCQSNHGMNHTASHQENACNAVVERWLKVPYVSLFSFFLVPIC